MAKENSIEAILMKLLRERINVYKSQDTQEPIVPNQVLKALRDEILAVFNNFNAPEKKKTGAYVYTQEASMAETEERQNKAKKKFNPGAGPRAV